MRLSVRYERVQFWVMFSFVALRKSSHPSQVFAASRSAERERRFGRKSAADAVEVELAMFPRRRARIYARFAPRRPHAPSFVGLRASL